MLVILSIFSGADLISADLKSKAFPLDSSPAPFAGRLPDREILHRAFLPPLLHTGAGHRAAAVQDDLLRQLGYFAAAAPGYRGIPPIACVFLASLTLALSILSSNTKFIQIAIFLVYMFSNNLAQILKSIFKSDYFFLLSLPGDVMQLELRLRHQAGVPFPGPGFRLPLRHSALAMIWLSWRIRKAEAGT